MGLVAMYQRKLGESEEQAEGRAILFVVFALVSVGLAVMFLITFPYQETKTEKIQLIPGNHTWVQELPTHEFLPVAVTYEQDFLRLAGEKETRVSVVGEIYIIYEVVEGSKPFQYRQYRDRSLFLNDYKGGVESPVIRDGVLIRTLHRDSFMVKTTVVVLAVIALLWAGPLRWAFISPKPRRQRIQAKPC